jgi:head-tail adaptor
MSDLVLLTDGELAILRTQVLGLLPDTAYLMRASGTVDSFGNSLETWGTVGTVAARIDPYRMTGQDVRASQEAGASYYQLTLPYDAGMTDGDRVKIDSVTYELKQVTQDHSARLFQRSLAVRVYAS